MRGFFIALAGVTVALVAGGPTAFAQAQPSSDPVSSAYRDYRAAERRDDLPGAETAAARALAASEARDGTGGSTAVLAMNLAIARMDMGHKADALAPARQALQLAQGGAKGVDELAARLTIGEAELAVDPKGDETAIVAALREADTRPDLDSFAYSAAVALADAASHAKHWANARTGWQSAQRHAHGASGDPNLALGDALIGEGAALIGDQNDPGAYGVLSKAIHLLTPLAPETADADHVTAAEFEYAQAWTWLGIAKARLISEGKRLPEGASVDWNPMKDKPSLPGRPPLCPGGIWPAPYPTFPSGAAMEYSVGSGVFRYETNDKGAATNVILLATAGGDDFRRALLDPSVHWSFRPGKKPPAGCRLDSKDRLMAALFGFPGATPNGHY